MIQKFLISFSIYHNHQIALTSSFIKYNHILISTYIQIEHIIHIMHINHIIHLIHIIHIIHLIHISSHQIIFYYLLHLQLPMFITTYNIHIYSHLITSNKHNHHLKSIDKKVIIIKGITKSSTHNSHFIVVTKIIIIK